MLFTLEKNIAWRKKKVIVKTESAGCVRCHGDEDKQGKPG